MNRWKDFTDEELQVIEAALEDAKATASGEDYFLLRKLFYEVSDELAYRCGAPLREKPKV
jgi:hypothetical protein